MKSFKNYLKTETPLNEKNDINQLHEYFYKFSDGVIYISDLIDELENSQNNEFLKNKKVDMVKELKIYKKLQQEIDKVIKESNLGRVL